MVQEALGQSRVDGSGAGVVVVAANGGAMPWSACRSGGRGTTMAGEMVDYPKEVARGCADWYGSVYKRRSVLLAGPDEIERTIYSTGS